MPEDNNQPDTSLPKDELITQSSTQKEFVIDVKGLDIRKEIITATNNFVKNNADANLEKTLKVLVDAAIKKLTPNYVKIGNRKQIKIEGKTHKAFNSVCSWLNNIAKYFFLALPELEKQL